MVVVEDFLDGHGDGEGGGGLERGRVTVKYFSFVLPCGVMSTRVWGLIGDYNGVLGTHRLRGYLWGALHRSISAFHSRERSIRLA